MKWSTAVNMRKNLGVILSGLLVGATMVLGVGGCTAGSVPEAPANEPVLQMGQEIYASSCRGCHRPNGAGGSGPRLNEGRMLEQFPDINDQIARVRDGKGGMPAFGERYTAEEIEAVVRYTREVLSAPGVGE